MDSQAISLLLGMLVPSIIKTYFPNVDSTMVNMILMITLPFLMAKYTIVIEYLKSWFVKKKIESKFKIKIYSEQTPGGSRNPTYTAISWYIETKIKPDSITNITYDQRITTNYYVCGQTMCKKVPTYDLNDMSQITDEDLTYEFNNSSQSASDKSIPIYCVTIYGSNMENITNKINEINDNYNKFIENSLKTKKIDTGIQLFTYCTETKKWIAKKIHLNRKFDNLFINENIKNKIKTDIDRLLNNTEYYDKYIIPRKLSMLLYGEPGCGKTSVYMTIANEYKLPIYIIKNSLIKNIDIVNDIPIRSILVFEEIDTFDIKNRSDSDFKVPMMDDNKENLKVVIAYFSS